MKSEKEIGARSFEQNSDSQFKREGESRVMKLESLAIQTQEEDEAQSWRQLENEPPHWKELEKALDSATGEIAKLKEKLESADSWVFRLAGERRNLEFRTTSLERELRTLTIDYRAIEVMLENFRRFGQPNSANTAPSNDGEDSSQAQPGDRVARVPLDMQGAAELKLQLQSANAEVIELTRLVRHKEDMMADVEARADWLRRVLTIVATRKSGSFGARLQSLLPAFWHRRRQRKQLLRAGLFDPEGYIDLYPDVSAAKFDPLSHYILHGIKEGRPLHRGG